MTNIYLIRHAEAEGNLYRRVHGQYDSLITEKGWKQIDCLEKRFEGVQIDAVYSSDLCRTQMTAAAIFKPRRLRLHLMPELREVNMGVWEDMPWGKAELFEPEQLRAFTYDPENWTVEGSEFITDLQDRIISAVYKIAGENEGKTVAAVTHGSALRAMITRLYGYRPGEIMKVHHCDNTAVTLLKVEGESIEVVFYGDSSHLPPQLSTFYMQKWWKSKDSADKNNLWFTPFDVREDMEFYSAARSEYWKSVYGGEVPKCFTERLESGLGSGSSEAFVARHKMDPVGVLELDTVRMCHEGAGYIEFYYIMPDMRDGGMGVQLIGQAISRYLELGRDTLVMGIPMGERHAIEFFKNYGFAAAGKAEDLGRELILLSKNISREREMILRGIR